MRSLLRSAVVGTVVWLAGTAGIPAAVAQEAPALAAPAATAPAAPAPAADKPSDPLRLTLNLEGSHQPGDVSVSV